MDKGDEYVLAAKDMDEVEEHLKTELIYQISPVTFRINSVPHYQTRQETLLHMTLFAPSSWKMKINGTPVPSI